MKRDPFMLGSRMTGCGLTVGDIQDVADKEIGRKLTKEELQRAEDPIGDYLAYTSWYEAILFGIQSLNITVNRSTRTKIVVRNSNAN
ncbi:MAG: hypothetical protein A2V79_03405 [Betaproteobacteria bacterium RBG_16_56_24]|nr:MAG: hypothetical protein A2V79_03405 [Betaproteobacteria bacterium RBG_16_56_24]